MTTITLTYRGVDSTKWGAGNGGPLSSLQGDMNMWTIQGAINSLLSSAGSYVSVTGSTQISPTQFNLVLSNGATVGPITLPMAYWNWRGAWAASTVYAENDVFFIDGTVYLTLIGTTSGTSFDPGATDGSGHNLFAAMLSVPGNVLPSGGTTNQMLAKLSNTDFDLYWVNPPVPAGGTTGQSLTKSSGTDYAVTWTTIPIVPNGGSTGQALVKVSGTDYDYAWAAVQSLPAGGSTGQALVKLSGSDFDVAWAIAESLPAGGNPGQVLVKSSYSDYISVWQDGVVPTITSLQAGDFLQYTSSGWVNLPFTPTAYQTSAASRSITVNDSQTMIVSTGTTTIDYTLMAYGTQMFAPGASVSFCQYGVGGSISLLADTSVLLQIKDGYAPSVSKLYGVITATFLSVSGYTYWLLQGDLDPIIGSTSSGPNGVAPALSGSTGVVTLDTSTFAELVEFIPTGDVTLNIVSPRAKTIKLLIITGGTTSYNITFGTGFTSMGVLATGTVTGKRFIITFVGDGTTYYEQSRTTAM